MMQFNCEGCRVNCWDFSQLELFRGVYYQKEYHFENNLKVILTMHFRLCVLAKMEVFGSMLLLIIWLELRLLLVCCLLPVTHSI